MNPILWKKNILDTVKKISSKSYQKKTWFGSNKFISSPIELYSELFDDYLFEQFLDSDIIELTYEQKELGIKLKEKLNKFSDQIEDFPSPYEVFNDQRWIEIRKLGRIFLEFFGLYDHLYQLGNTVKVKKDAPEQFRPAEVCSVGGIFEITTNDESQIFGYPPNTILYTVEFPDGSSIDLPESFLEK
ncbi:MAG: hypothetical protein JJU12_05775 [Chlamydiales bacterium]|nr:hypothetical protein [Chlamydiales bacterium]